MVAGIVLILHCLHIKTSN